MPEDTTTPDAVAAPEVDLESLPIAEYLEAVGNGFDDSSTVADVPAFEAGVEAIVEEMPKAIAAGKAVDKAVGVQSAIRARIASAIIAIRAAVVIRSAKGDYPDTFGTSDAYRLLYAERIVGTILKANPKLDRPAVAAELKAVRTGYLDESGTRAKGMVNEAIIHDAVVSGKVPGAEVQDDGKITIPVLTGKGEPKMVPMVDADGVKAKGEDGKPLMRQAVVTYKPGQTKDVPAILKPIVAQTIRERDRKNKEGLPMTKLPARFGGKPKATGGGGDTKDGPRDFAGEYRDALATLTEAAGHLATMEQVQWFHAAATVLCDTLNGQKDPGLTNPKDHAAVLLDVAHLLTTEAAVLDAKAKPDDLAPFRYVPEAPAPPAPEESK